MKLRTLDKIRKNDVVFLMNFGSLFAYSYHE